MGPLRRFMDTSSVTPLHYEKEELISRTLYLLELDLMVFLDPLPFHEQFFHLAPTTVRRGVENI